jgi:hypothetical protein
MPLALSRSRQEMFHRYLFARIIIGYEKTMWHPALLVKCRSGIDLVSIVSEPTPRRTGDDLAGFLFGGRKACQTEKVPGTDGTSLDAKPACQPDRAANV